MRMSKAERIEAELTLAKTLRGATNDSSRDATDAAIAGLDGAYDDIAEDIWSRIVQSILDAGIHYGGPLAEADRERLIDEICRRLGEALRAPVEEDA
jgi:hypothetical protein